MTTQTNLAHESEYRDRVVLTRAGVSVEEAAELMTSWSIPVSLFAEILGTSERKWSRLRAAGGKTLLNSVETDRYLRVLALFNYATELFRNQSDAAKWFKRPNRSMSDDSPLSLLDTGAGIDQVEIILTRIDYGVFS